MRACFRSSGTHSAAHKPVRRPSRYASACGGAALRTDEKNPKGDRGVLFNPQLPDGEFRQYGMLPLRLWAAVPGSASDGS